MEVLRKEINTHGVVTAVWIKYDGDEFRLNPYQYLQLSLKLRDMEIKYEELR